MKHLNYLPMLLGVFLLTACATVPVTGRSQINFVPDSTMLSTSFQQYDEFLRSHRLSTNQAQIRMVKNVGNRIARAVEQYLTMNGMGYETRNYQWEFNLVEGKEKNAWCMPGGKVVVYTGILPVTRDETGLAVVMGHEIAHAVAKHGNERMSQALLAQMGGMALGSALSSRPQETQELWMTVFGAGAQYGVLLPYGRVQETEADRLGLIFMAMAGYDPNAALAFWDRMSGSKGGAGTPEFLSTHPSDQTRIANLRASIPEAMRYYRR